VDAVRNCGFRALSDSDPNSADAVLFDADTMPAVQASELAAGTVPCIIIATGYDAARWSEWLKRGASSILRRPISHKELAGSLANAIPGSPSPSPPGANWLRRILGE
jgi:DNA-binding NtrC family response regulator